jgi:hypothetical protein
MANLKIIWTTGRPFSPASIEKIGYQISSGEFNIYSGSYWANQSSSMGQGYRPATAEEIAEHWKVLHPMWTPEPGDKVIVTQDIGKWCNKKGTIVTADGSEYWIVKRDYDGHTTTFMKGTQMILAPYEETAKPVETPKSTSPESMFGFTVGDIVIPECSPFFGEKCIVKGFNVASESVGVYCPSAPASEAGHNLGGKLESGQKGWWHNKNRLKLASKEEPMDLTKIIPGVGSFKVGDKVVAHSEIFKGCTGTIVRILSEEQPPLGVQFGEYHSRGHTLDGNCPIGYGWYYDKSDLTLVVENQALSKPSTPSTPTIPIPKEGYITVRLFTEEEFKYKDRWDTYGGKGHPTGWNSDGDMNKYLGTYLQIPKSDFRGHSFNYKGWEFRPTDYEVINEGVEPKPETTSKPGYITIRLFTEAEFKSKNQWDTYASCPKGWIQAMNKHLGETVDIRKDNIKHDGELSYSGWTFLVDNYEVLTPGYVPKSSPKVEPKVEAKVEPKEPEMKKQRFKVGDQVTYKSKSSCDGYRYGGNDHDGYVGTITSYLSYYSENGCYGIQVTSREGNYTMLESEFYEYDGTYPGAVTLGTSAAGSTPYILCSGASDTTFLGTVGLQIHQTIPKPKDDLSHYNQSPVLIHKKPTKRLVVVDAY